MAVKIVRQPKKIALIGAPSSAAAFSAGSEKAPAALRAVGLVEKLHAVGYEVVTMATALRSSSPMTTNTVVRAICPPSWLASMI